MDVNILMPPAYIDVAGMKKYFSIKKKKTYALLAQRKIKGKRDGKSWLISAASVFRFLNRYTNIREAENV